MATHKRFIAGAMCPRCQSLDTIFVRAQDDKRLRACVACDFKDEIRLQAPYSEIATRVNVTEELKARETQAIRILDPNKPDTNT